MAEVLPFLAIVTAWPQQVTDGIEALDQLNHERLLLWRHNINNALQACINFASTMEGVTAHINEWTWSG